MAIGTDTIDVTKISNKCMTERLKKKDMKLILKGKEKYF